MSGLQPAHRGYEYQDLMVALRSVDLLLGTLSSMVTEVKLVEDDRFDDLTIIDELGRRERVQFKHTDREDLALSLRTFTSDSRDLKLDRLLACAVLDRDGPGSTAASLKYRVVLRDSCPDGETLLRFLIPAIPDPGPFLPGMTTLRFQFDFDKVWPENEDIVEESLGVKSPFRFLKQTRETSREDFRWLCQNLVVEVNAPSMSGDLRSPGNAEDLLLNRVIQEIGAGQFPNEGRSPEDVARALIHAVRMARQGRFDLSSAELLVNAALRSDFGSVANLNPVDPALEVGRPAEIAELAAIARDRLNVGKPLIIEGPPGQGKSWACKQLIDYLRVDGWLVADHYCFLGAADNQREARVYTDRILGTL